MVLTASVEPLRRAAGRIPPTRRARWWSHGLAVVALLATAAAVGAQSAPPANAQRGWIGISLGDAGCPECVEGAGLPVTDVFDGSPAERAGIRAGDVLVRVNGRSADERSLSSFARRVRPGEPVRLTLRREGEVREVELRAAPRPAFAGAPLPPGVVARLDSVREAMVRHFDSLHSGARNRTTGRERPAGTAPPAPPEFAAPPPSPHLLGRRFVAGARLTAINAGLAGYFGVERGVLVIDVLDDTPAEDAGLRPGDVVLAVGDTPTATVEELRRGLLRVPAWPVTLTVIRRGEEMRVDLRR